jgi:CubicO group peptidase (beta-lactamase class C family)
VISGDCDPAYVGVREAFERNLSAGDLGASCAVTVNGEAVVDLWGGHTDMARTRPWASDTIVNIWSTTKMLSALCVLMLHDRGQLLLDSPVASYWPEFAANGKDGVLVRHVLGHTAGLPVFDDPVDDLAVFDWEACCAKLAAQKPRWAPGTVGAYHAETQGWLLGELVRRVDGRTLGAFLRDEVSSPLGLDVHIGLDDRHFDRVADVSVLEAVPPADDASELAELGHYSSVRSAGLVNTSTWRRSEMPASNAHANARSVAGAMAILANAGSVGGKSFLSAATIERTLDVQHDGIDRVTGHHMVFGNGFGLNGPATPLGVNDRTIWWAGWGGSMCLIDLENNMTVCYVMNRMLDEGDLRAASIIFAAHEARSRA